VFPAGLICVVPSGSLPTLFFMGEQMKTEHGYEVTQIHGKVYVGDAMNWLLTLTRADLIAMLALFGAEDEICKCGHKREDHYSGTRACKDYTCKCISYTPKQPPAPAKRSQRTTLKNTPASGPFYIGE
jgi:hypothetical protein